MDPRRNYQTRPDLSARLGTTPAPRQQADRGTVGLRPQRAPPSGPLLDSPWRGRGRSRLMVAAVVLLLIGLLAFAYVFVHVAFPQ
jgi:hypothetical protein